MTVIAPTLEQIREAQKKLDGYILKTPVVPWVGKVIERTLSADTELIAKLELMQFAGSFKVRGALLVMMHLSEEEKKRGVVAVSAGNHAIAVGYAAEKLGIDAKVVMPEFVSKVRIEKCKSRGAQVVLVKSLKAAFEKVEELRKEEGRIFVHPFEGENTFLGTATLGLEFVEQSEQPFDAVVVGVGGGGLAAGVASAVKQRLPDCKVYGVEPEGADSIYRSIAAGSPQTLEKVETIADSLGAPYALPKSFSLCSQYLDEVVRVSDQDMCESMAYLFYDLKLAVEPAAAAACAGIFGPLREKLLGKRVGVVLCGSSIDAETFMEHLGRAKGVYMQHLRGS